jgi:hypothetical protein
MGLRPLTTLLATAALATAALATVTATAASPADAQPATRAASPAIALQVTGVGCAANMELPADEGVGVMHCTAGVTEGTSPYSYQWAVTSGPAGVNPTGTKKFGTTSGSCTYGKYFVITVTVTDAAYATATNSATDFCDPEGP